MPVLDAVLAFQVQVLTKSVRPTISIVNHPSPPLLQPHLQRGAKASCEGERGSACHTQRPETTNLFHTFLLRRVRLSLRSLSEGRECPPGSREHRPRGRRPCGKTCPCSPHSSPGVAENPPWERAMPATAEMAFPDPGEAGISRCVCGQELPTIPVLVCLAVG